jgi:hypothetical protein
MKNDKNIDNWKNAISCQKLPKTVSIHNTDLWVLKSIFKILSVFGTEERGFESLPGCKALGIHTYIGMYQCIQCNAVVFMTFMKIN